MHGYEVLLLSHDQYPSLRKHLLQDRYHLYRLGVTMLGISVLHRKASGDIFDQRKPFETSEFWVMFTTFITTVAYALMFWLIMSLQPSYAAHPRPAGSLEVLSEWQMETIKRRGGALHA